MASSKSPHKKKAAASEDRLSSFEQAWQLIAIVLVAAAVAAATLKISSWIKDWYLPFCDSNSRSYENCIQCPEHGICQGGQLECLTGFRKRGRKCVEDSLIEKTAEKLARSIKDHVCSVNGQSICDGRGSVWLSEDEILDVVKLDKTKLQGPNLWLVQEKAVASASHYLDNKIHGVRVFCCPSHLVNGYKPFGCRLREWCFGNFLKLLVMLPLLFVLISLLLKYWQYKSRIGRAEELYAQVCEALEAKASGMVQSNLGNETWIVASRLRDHLLRPRERRNRTLWMEVERLVQEDSRIEQYPKIVKGESRIVWEWQVEGSLSPTSFLQKKTRAATPRALSSSPVNLDAGFSPRAPSSSPVNLDAGFSPVKQESLECSHRCSHRCSEGRRMVGGAGEGKDHHRGKGFWNPWPSFGFEGGVRAGLVMMIRDFDRKRCRVTDEVRAKLGLKPVHTDLESIRNPPKASAQITWIGHATFLVQFDNLNILTDPVWSDRCSPSTIVGPKRIMPVPFPLKELPPIDVVIISHNHYDHLDEATVKALGNEPLYLVPLGIKKWLNGVGITNVVELDWWEEHKLPSGKSKELKAVCTPCQHFSGRGIFDRNQTLWCSWVLEGETKRFYFAGDTGFCTVPRHSDHNGGIPEILEAVLNVCPAFEEIGKLYGPFDFAFIPIGAYSPRYFMSPIHCSPEDAVAIHRIVRSRISIAMHWGTFVLTDEPLMEPPSRLLKELTRLNIDPSTFITMKHGETKRV